MLRYLTLSLLAFGLLHGEDDPFMDGFDDTASVAEEVQQEEEHSFSLSKYGIEGEFKQEIAYGYQNNAPHDGVNSLRSTLFLEYNTPLWKDFKLKINGNGFYDWSYLVKGRDEFTRDELDALESQVELFDAYIQGSITKSLDVKLGRQVVVWGKSDTIRVVDVLNPLDNRRPGMTDIEDLRLPVTMAKFDYYVKNFDITPIVVLEQRKDKVPPFGGDFNPSPTPLPSHNKPNKLTYALNIAGEFQGFDLNFYYAHTYPNFEFYPRTDINIEEPIDMYGGAIAVVQGSWLFKSEVAYKQNYHYLQAGDASFDRFDVLVGFEYSGISDTKISFDIADKKLLKSGYDKDNLQGALRVASDFINQTLHANYLLSLFGESFDEGGYQRAWIDYDVSDSIKTTLGIVDYIGGNRFFDAINDNDMLFGEISYSF